MYYITDFAKLNFFYFHRLMATPPRSPPHSDNPLEVTSRRTRQSTRLRSLTTRSLDNPWPIVNVNPATGRGSGPYKEKFHSYLGVVAREKIPIIHSNWNLVSNNLKNLIWEDILVSGFKYTYVYDCLYKSLLNESFTYCYITTLKCNANLTSLNVRLPKRRWCQ